MKPITPSPTEKTWGDIRFLPTRFDPQEAKPWLKPLWAKYMDMKSVHFKPKKNVNIFIALEHLQALMACNEIEGGKRLVAAGYLCSLWFDSFEIEVDGEAT